MIVAASLRCPVRWHKGGQSGLGTLTRWPGRTRHGGATVLRADGRHVHVPLDQVELVLPCIDLALATVPAAELAVSLRKVYNLLADDDMVMRRLVWLRYVAAVRAAQLVAA